MFEREDDSVTIYIDRDKENADWLRHKEKKGRKKRRKRTRRPYRSNPRPHFVKFRPWAVHDDSGQLHAVAVELDDLPADLRCKIAAHGEASGPVWILIP